MKKIPTLFKRDPDDMRRVLPEVTPGCEWVLAGETAPPTERGGDEQERGPALVQVPPCDLCGREQDELGALLFGPPDAASTVKKKHLCTRCYARFGDQDYGPIERLRDAILDIDAHATPLGADADGFNAGGYVVTIGALHRAIGVVGHASAPCRYCQLLQADGKPGCDELRYEVGAKWTRDALESIAKALGVPLEADYGAKADGILLHDILDTLVVPSGGSARP